MTALDPLVAADLGSAAEPGGLLERLLAVAPSLGVTRVAVHTGLDRVGVPIAAAIRPNSRSLAVHQGRGGSLVQAKLSALMEAAECWHAETWSPPLRFARAAEIEGRVLDARRLPALRPGAERARLLWTEARDLADGSSLWVPFELASLDLTEDGAAVGGWFQATSNGLGAGTNWPMACLHGLLETIERDQVALWQARAMARGRREGRLDLDRQAARDPELAAILAGFDAAGADVAAWLAGSAFGTFTVFALSVPRDPLLGAEAARGSACDPDLGRALVRAATEAAQARLARIAGARDDYTPSSFTDSERARDVRAARRWIDQYAHAVADPPREAAPHGGTRELLGSIVQRIHQSGLGPVAWCNLSRGLEPIHVVRVVVEGFEGACGEAEYRPGLRALEAARAA